MREFSKLTGNNNRNKWAIGVGYLDFLKKEIIPLADKPIIGSYLGKGFVADPFLINHNGTQYVFFEWWNEEVEKGEICVVSIN